MNLKWLIAREAAKRVVLPRLLGLDGRGRRRRSRTRDSRGLWLAAGAGVGLAATALAVSWSRRMDLHDRVVLITGGSRGLGFLLAREFAHEGCRIAICARDRDELLRAAEDLRRTDAEVLAIPCDVTDPEQVRLMVNIARARFGRIDILVNNAGMIQVGPAGTMTIKDYEDALKVMLWGVVHPTMAVVPEMVERGEGRVVNITSIGGKVSMPHLLPYGCAKFAAVGFSEGLRAELLKDGVLVTTIVPGLMRTGSYLNAYFKGQEESEFTWFSLGATLPLVSMDARRAARQIIDATRRGQANRTLSLPAVALEKFHGVFPGLTAEILGQVNRFVLPRAVAPAGEKVPGREVQERVRSSVFNALTALGQEAAETLHQHPGPGRATAPGPAVVPSEDKREPAA